SGSQRPACMGSLGMTAIGTSVSTAEQTPSGSMYETVWYIWMPSAVFCRRSRKSPWPELGELKVKLRTVIPTGRGGSVCVQSSHETRRSLDRPTSKRMSRTLSLDHHGLKSGK